MSMIETEDVLSLAKYMPCAVDSDEPHLLGQAAAKMCCEALARQLVERGYSTGAIIDGMAAALSALISDTLAPRE